VANAFILLHTSQVFADRGLNIQKAEQQQQQLHNNHTCSRSSNSSSRTATTTLQTQPETEAESAAVVELVMNTSHSGAKLVASDQRQPRQELTTIHKTQTEAIFR
jgi:hypothetical protein